MKFENIQLQKHEASACIGEQIAYTIKSFGTREAGSKGESDTAQYLAHTLSTCCDDVKIEPFKVAPSAKYSWLYVSVTCMLFAYVAYFFSSLVAIAFIVVALVPFVLQYCLNKRALDAILTQKDSQNVFATKKCVGQVERRIVFTANYDAGYERSILFRYGAVAYAIVKIVPVVGACALLALSIARWAFVGGVGAGIVDGVFLYVGLAFLIFVPSYVATFFFTNTRRVVDGASSNLTGTYLLVEVLKAFDKCAERLQNTEICILLTGGKEAGNRGAKAFVDAHKRDFDDAETIFVTVDTLKDKNCICANAKDMRGVLNCSKKVQNLLIGASQNCGVECALKKRASNVTDACEFVQAGFEASSLSAIDDTKKVCSRTRLDRVDNLDLDCVADCFELVVQAIKDFSRETVDF